MYCITISSNNQFTNIIAANLNFLRSPCPTCAKTSQQERRGKHNPQLRTRHRSSSSTLEHAQCYPKYLSTRVKFTLRHLRRRSFGKTHINQRPNGTHNRRSRPAPNPRLLWTKLLPHLSYSVANLRTSRLLIRNETSRLQPLIQEYSGTGIKLLQRSRR